MRKLMIMGAMAAVAAAGAQNPVICDRYTPDPAPYVHCDTLYLFVDHDGNEDTGYFNMPDWLLYSTTDMVNWTYRGTPVSTATFSWAKQGNDAWAAQCVERNGKWYWFVTATVEGRGYPGIGVAVADRPEGPYTDLIGKPIAEGWYYIDPSVFIDSDGEAYLFWGNNNLWYGKLSKSMRTLSNITKLDTNNQSAFGPYKGYDDSGNPRTNFEEAPWIYKFGDTYYLEYAAGGVPEHWAYSTAPSVHGPWTYRGKVMGEAANSFTIHGGSVFYRGHHYMFYHNGKLAGGGGFKRATCIEEFKRGADGSLPFIDFTDEGVAPVGTINPYEWVEAETINQSKGTLCDGGGDLCYVTNIHQGDYLTVREVDFDKCAPTQMTVRVASQQTSRMTVKAGGKHGTIVARVDVPDTGGLDEWQEVTVDLSAIPEGVQDIYFSFSGTADDATLFRFDRWRFELAEGITDISADTADSPLYTIDGRACDGNARHTLLVGNKRKMIVK